ASSSAKRVLPIPGSPVMRSTPPRPPIAASTTARPSASSTSRPIKLLGGTSRAYASVRDDEVGAGPSAANGDEHRRTDGEHCQRDERVLPDDPRAAIGGGDEE